jgi:Protein of unknown function (DUF3006)
MNATTDSILLTIDEIECNRDGQQIATLVSREGLIMTVPVALLPEGAAVNHVVVANFRLDRESSRERAARVRNLQHRLFNRDSSSG